MSKDPIQLDANVAIQALEDHKTRMLGVVDDPRFRAFWGMMGGTTEYLDSAKEDMKKWKVK